MQPHALLFAWSFGCIMCVGQGSIHFTNRDLGVNAPFYDYQGRLLAGPAYVAQLYAGIAADSLTPVGATATFLSSPAGAGYFNGGEIDILFIPEAGPVWAQVRAWAVAGGATYEQAVAAGAYAGLSNVLFLSRTGNPNMNPSLPASLVGLQFMGVPEPEPWQLGLLGFGLLVSSCACRPGKGVNLGCS